MEKISLEDLAMSLVKHKMSAKTDFGERLGDYLKLLSKETSVSPDYQLEYFIFDLFTDLACFLQAFGPSTAHYVFEVYSVNLFIQHQQKGYELPMEDFYGLLDQRISEYRKFLSEYEPEFLKSVDKNSYLPGLGKAFSIHLLGHKDPAIIMMASRDFISKLRYLLPFYRKIAEEYIPFD